MGFVTTVSGYINIEGNVSAAVQRIEALPSYTEDKWPFLPREAFGLQIAKAVIQSREALTITYKGECIIPFGMSLKEVDYSWEEWLEKFEQLLYPMEASKAFVTLWVADKGSFFYNWRCENWWRSSTERQWTFSGEPRSFGSW
jgi:hypothetical protein